MRYYDIDLPITYADGNPIEREKIDRACKELLTVFGSFARQNERAWRYQGSQRVEIIRLEIVTTDDKVPRRSLKKFKDRLKESFSQIGVPITTYHIQTI